MAKEIQTGASTESPTKLSSNGDSLTPEELEAQNNLSPEDGSGADDGQASIRDDASLENQLGETQRLLANAQKREDKQYDDMLELTRMMAANNAQPQVDREDVMRREREELDTLETPGELMPYVERKIQAEVDARMRGYEAKQAPGRSATHDSLTRRAINDVIAEDPTLKPYKGEIDDWIFKKSTAEVRQQYSPDETVELASAAIARKHKDEIRASIIRDAKAEAGLERRVEGQTASSSSQVITEGDWAGVSSEQRDFCIKRGWSPEKMKAANKRYEDGLSRGAKGIRG